MKEYLELHTASSAKFWSINVSGSSHTVHFGRRGTNGQIKTKNFPSPEAATKDVKSLLASKLKKGYKKVKKTPSYGLQKMPAKQSKSKNNAAVNKIAIKKKISSQDNKAAMASYHEAMAKLEKYIHADAGIELEDGQDTIAVFNWTKLKADQKRQIREYHLGNSVLSKDLIPFAVIGVSGTVWADEGFEELSARGALLFDLGDKGEAGCSILSYFQEDGKLCKFAVSLSDIEIWTGNQPIQGKVDFAQRLKSFTRKVTGKILTPASRQLLTQIVNYVSAGGSLIPQISDKNWREFESITKLLSPVVAWEERDIRILNCIIPKWIVITKYNEAAERYCDRGFCVPFYEWLEDQILQEEEYDTFGKVRSVLEKLGVSEKKIFSHTLTELSDTYFTDNGRLSSAGNYLLSKFPTDIPEEFRTDDLFCLLAKYKTEEFDRVFPQWLEKHKQPWIVLDELCEIHATRYEKFILDRFNTSRAKPWAWFQYASLLTKYFPKKYDKKSFSAAQEALENLEQDKIKQGANFFSSLTYDINQASCVEKIPAIKAWLTKAKP
ncbi:WGR domain-containing protein [bacterium]|nr:WGR domain-containing protein [bacterium]